MSDMLFGWRAFQRWMMPPDASKEATEAMRMAFYSGAMHLFTTMMLSGDDDKKFNQRFDAIRKELRDFDREMRLQFDDTEGSA